MHSSTIDRNGRFRLDEAQRFREDLSAKRDRPGFAGMHGARPPAGFRVSRPRGNPRGAPRLARVGPT
jgi:hypothetical protein